MPGMDGCKFARGLRRAPGGDSGLLGALTGLGDLDALERTTGARFDADFTKPADPVQLLRLIADHAGKGVSQVGRADRHIEQRERPGQHPDRS